MNKRYGKDLQRGYSPKYYNIPTLMEALKDKELERAEIIQFKAIDGYDQPMVIVGNDAAILNELEAAYENIWGMKNRNMPYDELKKIMPAYLKENE